MRRSVIAALTLLAIVALVLAMGRREAKERTTHPDRVTIRQGITGKVEIWEGDFMPLVDPSSSKGKIAPGAGRRIRVHEPVKMEAGSLARRDTVMTPLVAVTVCDSAGKFSVFVTPGRYSVFVEEEGGWYSNGVNDEGIQGAVTVEPDRISDILIKITTKASF